MLAQALHLGLDEIVGAAVDHSRDGEVHGAQQRGGAAGEDDGIDDGDAKRRGIEHPEKPLVRVHDPAPDDAHYSSSRKE